MTAVSVGMRKLKITLSAEESSPLFSNEGAPCCADPKTRKFLAALLKKALPKTDFRLDCDRLYVEIYPSTLGGHIIYFTKAPLLKCFHKNPVQQLSLLLTFKDFEDLISLCKVLFKENFCPLNSRLYKYKGEYCLSISAAPSAIPYSIITEFADSVSYSNLRAALIGEYGRLLIKDDTLNILASF
ncbi:MAG: adaptor protein MecA [Clostridia bacterium]|nr:adaptor protein MecA [Clostridia bacterium]